MTGLWRFFCYSWVALLSAASDWLVFSALVSLAGRGHLESLMIARIIGGLVSFFANRHWTWKTPHRVSLTQQGRRFVGLYGLSYGTAVVLFSLLVDGAGMAAYPGKVITDGICFLFNFAVMTVYVFHSRAGLVRIWRAIPRFFNQEFFRANHRPQDVLERQDP